MKLGRRIAMGAGRGERGGNLSDDRRRAAEKQVRQESRM